MADKPGTEKIKEIFNWQGMTMRKNQEQKWEDMTLKSLETKLRCLPEVEVPETLKAKLFAAVPGGKAGDSSEHLTQWLPGAWGLGAAAAAVFILALIFVPDYNPSAPLKTLTMDLNDRSTYHVLADQNSAYIADPKSCGLQWPVVNLNEPEY